MCGKRYGRELCCDNANLTNSAAKYIRAKAMHYKGASLGRPYQEEVGSLTPPRKDYSANPAIRRVAHIVWAPKMTFYAVKFEKAATPHGKSPLAMQI